MHHACLLDTIEYKFDSVSMRGGIAQVMPLSPHVALPSGDGALRGDGMLRGDGVLSSAGVLPVLPALRELLPGGLPRGSVVAAGDWSLLCLALAAGASIAGAWCAIAGLPALGVAAAADAGLDPGRLLLIADPGAGWPQVVASLLDGCDLVLLRPPSQPSAQVRRRLEAVTRRHGGVLVVAGDWVGAQCRLNVTRQQWAGIGAGHGRLRARRVQVVTDGRGAAARPRARWLWLPGPDGAVAIVTAGLGEPEIGAEPVIGGLEIGDLGIGELGIDAVGTGGPGDEEARRSAG
jgi:uncharacterized membrane protein YdcZ (DUF606 family)